VVLAFEQAHVAGSGPFLRVFLGEFHALALAEQFENCLPHGTAVEEVFGAGFVADESKALVDQQPSDSPGWHTEALRSNPREHPEGTRPVVNGRRRRNATLSERTPVEKPSSAELEIRVSLAVQRWKAS